MNQFPRITQFHQVGKPRLVPGFMISHFAIQPTDEYLFPSHVLHYVNALTLILSA